MPVISSSTMASLHFPSRSSSLYAFLVVVMYLIKSALLKLRQNLRSKVDLRARVTILPEIQRCCLLVVRMLSTKDFAVNPRPSLQLHPDATAKVTGLRLSDLQSCE